jgi:hypothetical protein
MLKGLATCDPGPGRKITSSSGGIPKSSGVGVALGGMLDGSITMAGVSMVRGAGVGVGVGVEYGVGVRVMVGEAVGAKAERMGRLQPEANRPRMTEVRANLPKRAAGRSEGKRWAGVRVR